MSWTEEDLRRLQSKGLKINDPKAKASEEKPKPKIKIEKISIEKKMIEFTLQDLKGKGLIDHFETEFRFDEVRKFRFDWAIPSKKIAIEFEGIMSKKSRHTTVTGYSKDAEKYNIATTLGWKVLRYTVMNYLNLEQDLMKIISIFEEQNRTMLQHDTVSNNHNKHDLL